MATETTRLPGAVVRWNGDEQLDRVQKHIAKRLEIAGQAMVGEVKRELSVGQPTRRSVPRKPGNRPRLVSLVPATPGAPPRVLEGALRNSVDHEVRIGRRVALLRVGAFIKYAAWLEMVAGHPYLRPVLFRMRRKLVKLIADGSYGKKGRRR